MDDADGMKLQGVVQSDPEILGGTRVFVGTRVPVRSLVDHLEAGESIDDFLEGFPGVKSGEHPGELFHPTGWSDDVTSTNCAS